MAFRKITFYPNECALCDKRNSLKRCSGCNMKSYCSVDHQKKDWPMHKVLCQIIKTILKEEKVSHVFEKLRGVDRTRWLTETELIVKRIESRLGRRFRTTEEQLFIFCRACCVCYDTRQEMLKNCANCTWASFCKEHPTSPHHDKVCASVKHCHDLEMNFENLKLPTYFAVSQIYQCKKIDKLRTSATSMEDFLNQNIKTRSPFSERIKCYASEQFSTPLTIYESLQKLKVPPQSELVIHASGFGILLENSDDWEILLHLLPDLQILKILQTDSDEFEANERQLCKECCSKNKKLTVEIFAMSYFQYLNVINGAMKYMEPDIVICKVFIPDGRLEHRDIWEFIERSWSIRTCPLVITTRTEKKLGFIKKHLETTVWGPLIIYEGLNNFGYLWPHRDFENGGISRKNQFVIVCESQQSKGKQRRQQQNHAEDNMLKSEAKPKSEDSGKDNHEIKTNAKEIIEGKATKSSGKKKKSRVKSTLSKEFQIRMEKDLSKSAKQNVEKVEYQPKRAGDILNDVVDPVMENPKVEADLLITEYPTSEANPILTKEELLEENLKLKEQNRLLKENIFLKIQNKKLRDERLELEQENENLKKRK